ncbi:MAG: YciI family protein [Sandaracinus sp.]
MPELMLMVVVDEPGEERLAPAEVRALVEGHTAWEKELREATILVDAERLRPSSEGVRVRGRGDAQAQPGPFGAEALSAYAIVRAEGLDQALALARRLPVPPGAKIEVRPIMKRHTHPEKTSQPGRVFAFGVLGSAPSEEGWIEVMDRIDARTRNGFPGERWLGGVRLEAPRTGRRLASGTIFDGPFLESKEVIGGLFFLRMQSMAEAVAWAAQTPFVDEGALEIREVWRS